MRGDSGGGLRPPPFFTMEKIIFKKEELSPGRFLARVTLNRPKALNVLDFDMAIAFRQKLLQWKESEDIVGVLLEGAGDKAFCAGGDVKSLYYQMKDQNFAKVDEFFQAEYSLDQEIHNFPKPIVIWGDGIVMGGGIGLFAGASHKVVSERTVMAMPEVSIGFFPDVGASYFLNQMPDDVGLFLGVTGARFSGSDGVCLGLGDFLISSDKKSKFLQQFAAFYKKNTLNQKEVGEQISRLLQNLSQKANESDFIREVKEFCSHCDRLQLLTVLRQFEKIAQKDNSLLSQTYFNLKEASPLAVQISWQQLQKSRGVSLEEAFAMELVLASKLARSGEFQEGVRALLVDKDKTPNWKYKKLEDINDQILREFF